MSSFIKLHRIIATFVVFFCFITISNKVFAGASYHTVRKGDTLSELSRQYKVKVTNLKKWNNLRSNLIVVGQKLRLRNFSRRTKAHTFYRVRPGDTLSQIAQKYRIKVRELKKFNKLRSNIIFVGQKLRVRNQYAEKSVATLLGLKKNSDDLGLNSSAAIVIDQHTNQVLFEKNADVALPIASLTKLMTALLVIENNLDLGETIEITKQEANLERYNFSRLKVGSKFSREDLLHLALMSSENRAAHALGRTFPGGERAFVNAMNVKSKILGMWTTKFTEPTGLNSGNVSSARDLAKLIDETSRIPLIEKFSTSKSSRIRIHNAIHKFKNSNSLVRKGSWDILVSKTGFIKPSGKCLAMIAKVRNNPYIIITLDATASSNRTKDAKRIFAWLSAHKTRSRLSLSQSL